MLIESPTVAKGSAGDKRHTLVHEYLLFIAAIIVENDLEISFLHLAYFPVLYAWGIHLHCCGFGRKRFSASAKEKYKSSKKVLDKCKSICYDYACSGGLAQLGERLNGIQEVSGSIPLISTKKTTALAVVFLMKSPVGLMKK